MKRMGILLAAAFALAACATAETETASTTPAAERDCFRNEDTRGYTVIDDHNIGLSVGTRDYILTTRWNARDLDWTQAIAIRSQTGWICVGNGLGVELIGGTPQRTFPVSNIARAPNNDAPTGS